VESSEGFQPNKEVHYPSCIAVVGTVVEFTHSASGVLKLLISVCVCVHVCVRVCVCVCVYACVFVYV